MIFAHGPFGYLCVTCARRIPSLRRLVHRASRHSRRFLGVLAAMGFLGGIFPDIDIFYTSLVDGSRSHRLFITHTPLLYIGFFLLMLAVTSVRRQRAAILIAGSFALGALSHIATDSIGGKTMLLFPFSSRFFGLVDLNVSFITANLLFFNFLLEGIFIVVFFLLLLTHSPLRQQWKNRLIALDALLFSAGVVFLLIANTHIYHAPADMVLGDNDHDDLLNVYDRDMDGDGIQNVEDADADNDGIANIDELSVQAQRFEGVWQDPTNGGLLGVPLFHGFITADDTPRRLLQTIGISLRAEMEEDFRTQPEGYIGTPRDGAFDRDRQNIRAYLAHRFALHPAGNTQFQPGDLLFFTSGHQAVVVGNDTHASPLVLDVHSGRRPEQQPLSDIITLEGSVIEYGTLLR